MRARRRCLGRGDEQVGPSSDAATGAAVHVPQSQGPDSVVVTTPRQAHSYSQLDRAAMQVTDLAEGLERTLVMQAHHTRRP